MRKSIVLAALVLLAPGVSQAKSLEDLLVEKGVITKGEARAASSGGPAKVYWNGGTRVGFPDAGFDFGINTLIKTRYTFTDNDEDSGAGNTSSFDVTHGRIILHGSALNNEFESHLNVDFVSNTDGDSKSPELLDAVITWNACDNSSFSMGQWKTGIGRQFLADDETLQFADRSITSDFFNLGRQAGAGVDLDFGSVTVGAAIFNGESTGEGINRSGTDTRHTGVANVRWDALGEMNVLEEGDIDGTDGVALNFGAAYAYSQTTDDTAGQIDRQSVSVDGNLKASGASLHSEIFWTRYDPEDSTTSVEPAGAYIQGGYFVLPKELEVAGRYAIVDCEDPAAPSNNGINCTGNDQVHQATAGLNYYFWRHNIKAQFNIDYINVEPEEGDNSNTVRYILAVQSYL